MIREFIVKGPPWNRTAVLGLSAAMLALAASASAVAIDEAVSDHAHWAYQRLISPSVPAVKHASWESNPLDAFVLAKLGDAGLEPARSADRRTLIRRAYFDLIGLPPSPHEVDEFVHDLSPDAFSRVVDRLLNNPHYGERWTRYWLDVARYADTKGYVGREEPKYPYAYTYRDYVIRAFNEDKPYDRFLIEQIAADKLPLGNDKSSLAAMGFLTLGRRFINVTPEIIDDRIDVVCRGTMGLSVGCARCHDHKFDPIPTEDYYSLYSIFNNSREPSDPPLIGEPSDKSAYMTFTKELAARQHDLDVFFQKECAKLVAPLRSAKKIADYLMATRAAHIDPQAYAASGIGQNPFMVDRWKDYLRRSAEKDDCIFRAWRAYAAISAPAYSQKAKATTAIFARRQAGRPLHPFVLAAFRGAPPASLQEVAERYGALLAQFDSPEKLANESAEELRRILYGVGSPFDLRRDQLENLFLQEDREQFILLSSAIDSLKANSPGAPPRAMVLQDAERFEPQYVLVRGRPGRQGKKVKRHFLTCIAGEKAPTFTNGSGRLELAQAIADRQNPFTARVMANRIWLHHFGFGIVRTPSDFGTRGDPPTHPRLLDYLAMQFMRGSREEPTDRWSIKKLQRMIMLSSTYQMSSDASPKALARDPQNLLLSHFNRQRLDFESMRDALLFVSGSLDPTLYGRSIDIEVEPFCRRRTVYAFIDRQNLPGVFRSFDFASPDTTCPRRFTTTVPQQALFMMNSPFVLQQTKALLARSEIAGTQTPRMKIESLYRLLFNRAPSDEETSIGLTFVESESRVEYGADFKGSRGPTKTVGHLAAWRKYAQILLESNELAFID
jgi:hypothetical protein